VDRAGFEREMGEQRDRARRGAKMSDAIFVSGPLSVFREQAVGATTFVGYGETRAKAQVVGLVSGESVAEEAGEGAKLSVVLDRTPFYAESGGQVGDRGLLRGEGFEVRVFDTQGQEGFVLHLGVVRSGGVRVGDEVEAVVDETLRDATRRNHTATHLLHAALKQVLGDHVRQEGSLVAPEHLRFDFSHAKSLTPDEVGEIESLVNGWILRNDPVETDVMGLDEAKASGAVSLFGEKYGDDVRVVGVASGSRELCGGTHCWRTGDIGAFRITTEASIAAGVRRIEAVTGQGAVQAASLDRGVVRELSVLLKAGSEEIVPRVHALQDEIKNLRKAEEKVRREAGLHAVQRLVDEASELGGLRVQMAALPGVDGKALRSVWDGLKQGGVDVGVIVGEAKGKAPIMIGLSKAALQRGLDAKALLGDATGVLGGGGGGRPDLAQGQGQDRGRIDEALAVVRARLEGLLATA
jgi:alanyl-tRNA synthetase